MTSLPGEPLKAADRAVTYLIHDGVTTANYGIAALQRRGLAAAAGRPERRPLTTCLPQSGKVSTEDRRPRPPLRLLTSPRSQQGHLVPPEVVWRAMKLGGPWNLRGLRPDTREAARDAARRSGMSVGEWLNNVIQQGGNDDDYGEPMRAADYDDDYEDDWRPRPRRRRPDRESALAREEISEVNARLDRLTHQLERMTRNSAARLTGAPPPQHRGRAPPLPRSRSGNRSAPDGPVTVDTAAAEIAERQRALYGDSAPI